MTEFTNLKRATVSIPQDLDYKFKKVASQKFKFEKGWYSKAMIEAMRIWLKYNNLIQLKNGTDSIGRFLGKLIWDEWKQNFQDVDFQTPNEPTNQILNNFSNKSTYVENIDYHINNDDLKIYLKSYAVKDKPYMVENLLTEYLQPITIITRAGIEEVTGDDYKINEFKVGKSSKIHLKKVD
ncbi:MULTISPECIES: hypothetical protein [Methanobacterium]|jgi:hypothetical protein|uniref:Uncharacterized protein n=1 Tax=Methanobacterium bryantii TaxID=2161 RepID=A0A2A2H394_METBR|nr:MULTISPECIES: hypothetical protein [Methanobacterium]OEC85988.1 hypothetical protein A9507_11910 [Methanobacterium sp. A39]PAV03763.1 hypothetical protein ASJ80_02035 [Methanobacterium bryantii]